MPDSRPHPPTASLPETPHDLPIDRGKVDALVDRVRAGEHPDLLDAFLGVVDWRGAFGPASAAPGRDDPTTGEAVSSDELSIEDIARLVAYYRAKFADVGPIYLAELLSTEFMTEQRARGDAPFSDHLLALGREQPELWAEIRAFFRRKEFVTALLALGHRPADLPGHPTPAD
ncbi:MAG: hypothetical protein H0U40_13775 [Chloroflexia bacterium]|nr:hypothetical protein [Chloroflexia bacterium]